MSLAILLGPPGALVAECAERISAASGRSCLIVDDAVEAVAGESPERIVTSNLDRPATKATGPSWSIVPHQSGLKR